MAQEEGVAGGAADHAQQSEPHIREALGWEPAVAYAQHVGHSLEQGPRVLLEPVLGLEKRRPSSLLVSGEEEEALGARRRAQH